jgi:UDP-N-acetylglucosamine 2-epimerase (non-hydrolysing)
VKEPFGLVTLHRPGNVDDRATLTEVMAGLERLSADLPLLFPVHPRTRQRLTDFGLVPASPALTLTEPLGYVDFMALTAHAALVVTDSGGIQEETSVPGDPLPHRPPQHRAPRHHHPGDEPAGGEPADAIVDAGRDALGRAMEPRRQELWDGRTAGRIVDALTATA